MKIAFWSGGRTSGSVMENMAAISVILALLHKTESVLSSNYISNYTLQDCFAWRNRDTKEEKEKFTNIVRHLLP